MLKKILLLLIFFSAITFSLTLLLTKKVEACCTSADCGPESTCLGPQWGCDNPCPPPYEDQCCGSYVNLCGGTCTYSGGNDCGYCDGCWCQGWSCGGAGCCGPESTGCGCPACEPGVPTAPPPPTDTPVPTTPPTVAPTSPPTPTSCPSLNPPAGLTPNSTITCDATSTTLYWYPVDGAEAYEVRVDDFGSGTANGPRRDCAQHDVCVNRWTSAEAGCVWGQCSMNITGLSLDRPYTWWVQSDSSTSCPASDAASTSFSTATCPTPTPACPASPTGLYPNGQTFCQTNSIVLQWDPTPNAAWYDLRVDDLGAGTATYSPKANNCNPAYDVCVDQITDAEAGCPGGVGTCQVTITNLTPGLGHQYDWWIHAGALGCSQSSNSDLGGFTIGLDPSNLQQSCWTTLTQAQTCTANFSWDQGKGASSFYWQLYGPAGYGKTDSVWTGTNCDGSTCTYENSVDPSTFYNDWSVSCIPAAGTPVGNEISKGSGFQCLETSPTGDFDSSSNCSLFTGWAADDDAPGASLSIDFRLEPGGPGTPNEDILTTVNLGSTTTNASGFFSFDPTTITNCLFWDKAREVSAYATNVETVGGTVQNLPNSCRDGGANLDKLIGEVTVGPCNKAWYQTQGGDVHSQGDISSRIIGSQFFSMTQGTPPQEYHGLVSMGGTTYAFGASCNTNLISEKRWLVTGEAYSPFTSSSSPYAYFYKKVGSPTTANFTGSFNEITGGGVFFASGNVTLTSAGGNKWKNNFPNNLKAIILVYGNLNIQTDIRVPVGGFLAFIVSGDINIKGTLGDKVAGNTTPHVQGMYIADGTIKSNSDNDNSGMRLVGAGLFYGRTGVEMTRDLRNDPLSTVHNYDTPAELFIFRPDFVINAPQILWGSNLSWMEVAP